MKFSTIDNTILLIPAYEHTNDEVEVYNKNDTGMKSMMVQYTFFLLALRLPLETLIFDEHFRSNIMHKRPLECNRVSWYKLLCSKVETHYTKHLRSIFSLLKLEPKVYEVSLVEFESKISNILIAEYKKFEYLDYDQIIHTIERCTCQMLKISRAIFLLNSSILEQNYYFFNSFVSYTCCYEINEQFIALTDNTMINLHFYETNSEFKTSIIKQNKVDAKEYVFNLNFNRLFLDLLYVYSNIQLCDGDNELIKIDTKKIFTKFSLYFSVFAKFDLKHMVSNILDMNRQKIKMFIDFNKNHLKLFIKIYIRPSNNDKTNCYIIIDKISDMLSTSITNKKTYISQCSIENDQNNIVLHDYFHSSFGSKFRLDYKNLCFELRNFMKDKKKNVKDCMRKLYGDKILRSDFGSFFVFLDHLKTNFVIYQNLYAEIYEDRVKTKFINCSFSIADHVMKNPKMKIFYNHINIFCSYLAFYNILITREKKDSRNITNQCVNSEKLSTFTQKENKFVTEQVNTLEETIDKEKEVVKEKQSIDIKVEQKKDSQNDKMITTIPTESTSRAITNPIKKQKKKIITKEEQLKKSINAERANKIEKKIANKRKRKKLEKK